MRTLCFWVLLLLAACKPAPKEPQPPLSNPVLGAKLEAFGEDDSKANLEACLNVMRTARLFIGVQPNPAGSGGKAAIKLDEQRGQVLYAFLEEPAAKTWWSPVEGMVIQSTPAPEIFDVASFEQADVLIIDPHLPSRSMVIPRDNYAPIARAWAGAADAGAPR